MAPPKSRLQQIHNVRKTIGFRVGQLREVGGGLRQRLLPIEQRKRAMREMAERENIEVEQRNDRLINEKFKKLEQERIYEKLLESMGIHGRINKFRASRDPRIRAMAKTIHSIFGPNVSLAEISNINRILQNNLHPTAQFLMRSPELQTAIERIRTGRAKDGGPESNLFIQASMDILRNDQVGQQILQANGIQ